MKYILLMVIFPLMLIASNEKYQEIETRTISLDGCQYIVLYGKGETVKYCDENGWTRPIQYWNPIQITHKGNCTNSYHCSKKIDIENPSYSTRSIPRFYYQTNCISTNNIKEPLIGLQGGGINHECIWRELRKLRSHPDKYLITNSLRRRDCTNEIQFRK